MSKLVEKGMDLRQDSRPVPWIKQQISTWKHTSDMTKISKWIPRILAIVVLLVVASSAGFVLYFSNALPAAAEAISALQSTASVTVTDTSDQIIFMPKTPPLAGLIFYPGGRVAPAAYAARLKPVAERGYAVFIVKFPLNLAFFGTGRAGEVIAAHADIKKWAIGGHSLGGAFACSFLEGRSDIKGLILYASYPANNLSSRDDLLVASIYGTNDALATIEKVTQSALPSQTRYVPIEGGIHSFFGDYGLQDGDGTPGVSREDAAKQIVAATIEVMDEVARQ